MTRDLRKFLWLLKLGALVNLAFFARTLGLSDGPDSPALELHLVLPAQILFLVSAYRCLFPTRYGNHAVLHDTVLSSTLVTRVLATFSEVAYIYQFAYVLRLLNVDSVGWIDVLAGLMVCQVALSQLFVWGSILTGRRSLFVYEEAGWAVIYGANTVASAYLYATAGLASGPTRLLELSLVFGAFYLPWQVLHLRSLVADAWREAEAGPAPPLTAALVRAQVTGALHARHPATDAAAWGGWIGLTWMTAYWATLIPLWVYAVVHVLALA